MAALIPIPCRLVRTGIFLLLWTVCLAAAAPKISNIVPKRGISEDPSCPAGWLCKSQSCEAICPTGEVCIAFEGTLICAPEGQTWCALNPSTFQAVKCQNDGVCCHGNCYKPGTVCCDNAAILCAVGDLCLACPGSETCTTGASTCAASGTPQSTTTRQTTTTTRTTATRTSEQPATTTSGVPVKPTIVQQDGNFKYKGCFVDTAGSHALVVGNKSDTSSTGMTVKKCIALAKQQHLRYAGVEVGSQCYFGNTLHTNNKASDSDCSTVCAGALNELCGKDNRLQVYEDITWSDPTLDQLTEVVLQYNNTLFELQTLTTQYKNLIQRWANQQNGNHKKRWLFKRQSQTITLTELNNGLTAIERRYSGLQHSLEQAAENGGIIYSRAASRDVIRPGQGNPFIDAPTLENAQHAFDIPLDFIRNVQNAIEDDLRSIAESTRPLLNIARDLQAVGKANSAIGILTGTTLVVIAAGQGLFALLALIFLHLHPSESTGQPITTPASPSHITVTSSSTTTSSASATATPYLIVAANGISESEFQAFTDKLSTASEDKVINSPFAIARVASLDDKELDKVRKNPIVFSVTPNKLQKPIHGKAENLNPRLVIGKRTAPARGTALDGSTIPSTKLTGRDGLFDRDIGHLHSLSQKWFREDFTDGFDYVFEADAGKDIFIYVIDDGVQYDHPEFQRIQKDPEIVIGNYIPERTHGTAVAGLAVGKLLGVASSATLISVAYKYSGEDNVMKALKEAYNDIIAKGRQGKAVINMSWGLSSHGRLSQDYWLAEAMRDFINIGAIPVCAAGNDGEQPGGAGLLNEYVPALYSSRIDGIITVGSVDKNGKRDAFTAKCDLANSISVCLSAYAMGSNVITADSVSGHYETSSGTSLSTGVISGLVAYLMAHPSAIVQERVHGGGNSDIADRIAFLIDNWSWSRNPTGGVDFPNVAWNGVIANFAN